ncbi:pyridoxamine 5'-phosphate oxidase family protein [Microbacterium sp. H1-D42]|uniref:pyridoxamine 5'-phosphate oxidase family protein n=1 Tax=Microbacterium sp. H1-D42 TaxID=2925844 RepID=UPI001F52E2E2|nr:pyridoxamine 5'-phosphate oxidase family protein [Microbacterium sp. H1-D42]UNK71155.1 pyridoxamine 5'-phosphate oxidase family protein [Microbacterium sp. H1-D42]
MFTLDTNDTRDAKALGMLQSDLIGWITTVSAQGEPRSVPVWFYWDDTSIVVLTQPGTAKVTHLLAGSPVQFHLHAGGPYGDDVVIIDGDAEVAENGTAEWMLAHRDAYEQKYSAAIKDYGQSIDQIIDTFSTRITITPRRLRAW